MLFTGSSINHINIMFYIVLLRNKTLNSFKSIACGKPKTVKNLTRALTIVFAVMFFKGTASRKWVKAHIIVSFPSLVSGNGPTQSIMTLEKCRYRFCGAIGFFWLGFTTTWRSTKSPYIIPNYKLIKTR